MLDVYSLIQHGNRVACAMSRSTVTDFAVQMEGRPGQVPARRGHLSCVWKEKKESLEQKTLLMSWAEGTQRCGNMWGTQRKKLRTGATEEDQGGGEKRCVEGDCGSP